VQSAQSLGPDLRVMVRGVKHYRHTGAGRCPVPVQ